VRTTRLRDRLALLLAGALGLAAFTAAPAAGADPADDPVEVHGLKGEYYTQSAPGAFDFHELKATAFDPSLDFDNLEPRLAATTGQSDDVSVRWTGRLVPEKTGAHTFSVSADNGFRLWVGGSLVIDHWVDDWDVEQTSAPVELTAGRAYDIQVEYFEHCTCAGPSPAAARSPSRSRRSCCPRATPTTAPSRPPSSPTAAP
jgi:hypothetical protein